MLTKRMMLLALWTAACASFPVLATVSPIVKPAIDKVPNTPIIPPYVTPENTPPFNPNPIKADPRYATSYYDGRVAPAEAVCETVCSPYPVVTAPVAYQSSCSNGGSGWWTNGPVRRFVSAPVRGIGRFFRNGGFLRRWR
jgi:hypothetical protein